MMNGAINAAQAIAQQMGGNSPPGGAYAGAQNAITHYASEGQNALAPYNQFGQQAQGGLSAIENQFSNPEEAFNNWAKNYSMSPGAQFQLHHGVSEVRNAMAAKGLSGSGPEAEALTNYTQGVINEDMNHQWNNVLNGGRLGVQAGSQLYNGGVNAARGQAALYGQTGANIAGLKEAQEQQKAEAQRQKSNDTWSAIGAIGGLAEHFL